MKKFAVKLMVMVAIAISFSTIAQGQFVLKIRPAAPVLTARPACPTTGHVWVGGNYVWRGNQYVYTNGYWAPPRQGQRWAEGHWKNRRGGWVWIPGHWRR